MSERPAHSPYHTALVLTVSWVVTAETSQMSATSGLAAHLARAGPKRVPSRPVPPRPSSLSRRHVRLSTRCSGADLAFRLATPRAVSGFVPSPLPPSTQPPLLPRQAPAASRLCTGGLSRAAAPCPRQPLNGPL